MLKTLYNEKIKSYMIYLYFKWTVSKLHGTNATKMPYNNGGLSKLSPRLILVIKIGSVDKHRL